MAFRRKVELKVSLPGQLVGSMISDLDISFDFERSTSPTPNICKIDVYNANQETRDILLQKESNVILNAGYLDEVVGTIFIGKITEVMETRQPPDIITHLEVCDAPLALETKKSLKEQAKDKVKKDVRTDPNANKFKALFLSYKRGTNFKEVIRDIGTNMNAVTFGLDQIDFVCPPSGYYFVGSVNDAFKDALRVLESHGFSMYQDGVEIIVYRQNNRFVRGGDVIYLTPNTGLLYVKRTPDAIIKYTTGITQDNIEFASLLNPRLQPNGVVKIDKINKSVNGTYIIDKVFFKGDNFGGGEYTTKCLASSELVSYKNGGGVSNDSDISEVEIPDEI